MHEKSWPEGIWKHLRVKILRVLGTQSTQGIGKTLLGRSIKAAASGVNPGKRCLVICGFIVVYLRKGA